MVLILGLLGLNLAPANNFKQQSLATRGYPQEIVNLSLLAAQEGDYTLAQSLYSQLNMVSSQTVLGVNLEIEAVVYPEIGLANEIERLESRLTTFPSRLLFLKLALYNWQLDNFDQAKFYLTQAQALDPNDPTVSRVKLLLGK
jgi:tetratricopeptide (TPR) repeat protein